MQDFTFLCIRSDGSIPAIDIQPCQDEDDAVRRLPALFREHDSCTIIEIWTGSRRVREVERQAA